MGYYFEDYIEANPEPFQPIGLKHINLKKASEAMKRVSKKKEEKKPQMDATTKKLHKWRKDKEHAEREKYVSPFRPIGDD